MKNSLANRKPPRTYLGGFLTKDNAAYLPTSLFFLNRRLRWLTEANPSEALNHKLRVRK
jgi:hypothetical protein